MEREKSLLTQHRDIQKEDERVAKLMQPLLDAINDGTKRISQSITEGAAKIADAIRSQGGSAC